MAKAVTLKNSNNEEIYPVTNASLVNDGIYTDTQGTAVPTTADVTTARIVDGAVTTDKLADDAVGWKYLGCVHTETATSQLDFTLPEQYDNYRIIASAEMASNAPNNVSSTLACLNGSSVLQSSGFQEYVNGTSWSCGSVSAQSWISQIPSYSYFSVFHEVLSMRSRHEEWRHYMTNAVSGGGNTNGKTTRGNMHNSTSTEPTGFRLATTAGNYIRSGSIYVWGMNNPS